ncbi:MAG: putative manganese-dependent inorganic diphosphatase [Eubacteriales bacterium]|nr:putative manganese-dependent inorganic diphosphatase [Eubacteriales bacterium]MDD3199208.1 putative manganese-dependent inorganic diphosphatase [Eubacteriales bacterium]MDD4122085.1 putative manganese-dependent inorganic diphosphatase [Eubacteriales bacterium]MDD4629137.1 putative manganese-dependent inorganic diphosphatase [Eubacteriales bacterium]
MSRKVLVIGHKNPDTDSICSSIAYANLKNQLTEDEHIPKRAGDISDETKFVLDKFHVEIPEYIQDVGTQVRDIDMRKTTGVQSNISLKKAWGLMRDLAVATLPVTANMRLEGIISVKDIATANMDIYDNRILAKSEASYKNIVETLDGTMIVGKEDDIIKGGKILIAASSPDTLESYMDADDIIILSNRYELQLCAIEMGAGCIIVCTGAPVAITIKKLAAEKGCHIISTPYDTYIVARLINQSTPISYFMRKEDLITFETDDFTEDVKSVMAKVRHRDFPVLDIYGDYFGMISRRSLLDVKKKRVILVDHNEKSQAVDGLEAAEIAEIIDHHRLGNLETITPVFFRNQPVGCTATIIYQMYIENRVGISRDMAGILCAAIITDTLMFRSPTCTADDRNAAEALAAIAEIQIREFAEELFQAGSGLGDKTPEEMLYQDFKTFSLNTVSFAVGQNTFTNTADLQDAKVKMLEYLRTSFQRSDIDMLFIMLTNILDESTELLFFGEGAMSIAETAMKVKAIDDSIHLKGVVSRKKQLIPALMTALQQQ